MPEMLADTSATKRPPPLRCRRRGDPQRVGQQAGSVGSGSAMAVRVQRAGQDPLVAGLVHPGGGAGHGDGDELPAGPDRRDVDARHGLAAAGVARAFNAEARSGVRNQVGEGFGTAASRGGGCPSQPGRQAARCARSTATFSQPRSRADIEVAHNDPPRCPRTSPEVCPGAPGPGLLSAGPSELDRRGSRTCRWSPQRAVKRAFGVSAMIPTIAPRQHLRYVIESITRESPCPARASTT
jgi:hypothetical protein